MSEDKKKWQVAHLGGDRASQELHQQILSRFRQIYRDAGEPEGVALFEAIDSSGQLHALCLNPAAMNYCSVLLEESTPWYECETSPDFNLSWVAGDKRLNCSI